MMTSPRKAKKNARYTLCYVYILYVYTVVFDAIYTLHMIIINAIEAY